MLLGLAVFHFWFLVLYQLPGHPGCQSESRTEKEQVAVSYYPDCLSIILQSCSRVKSFYFQAQALYTKNPHPVRGEGCQLI